VKTIAVVGASGGVGTELCLTLLSMPDIRVVAICRSRLASALLERCGVECRIGSVSRPDTAAALLSGVDAVFDLAFPDGPEFESRALNRAIITSAIQAAPPGARYVYASSCMAVGLDAPTHPGERFVYRVLSRTAYGARKRYLERAAFAAGRRHRRDVFVLRLGQVYGEMQHTKRRLLATIGNQLTAVPDGPSNTVFVCTIAEGLVGIAEGRERPGTYMVTSEPQWSWRELHEYFAEEAGVHPVIVEETGDTPGLVAAARSRMTSFLLRRRDLVRGYVLPRLPTLERRARALIYVRSARAEAASLSAPLYRPYACQPLGSAPGPRLRTPSDSRANARAYAERVRKTLLGAGP
jgi:nucleoside-diphosphate-sugar epimerase